MQASRRSRAACIAGESRAYRRKARRVAPWPGTSSRRTASALPQKTLRLLRYGATSRPIHVRRAEPLTSGARLRRSQMVVPASMSPTLEALMLARQVCRPYPVEVIAAVPQDGGPPCRSTKLTHRTARQVAVPVQPTACSPFRGPGDGSRSVIPNAPLCRRRRGCCEPVWPGPSWMLPEPDAGTAALDGPCRDGDHAPRATT